MISVCGIAGTPVRETSIAKTKVINNTQINKELKKLCIVLKYLHKK